MTTVEWTDSWRQKNTTVQGAKSFVEKLLFPTGVTLVAHNKTVEQEEEENGNEESSVTTKKQKQQKQENEEEKAEQTDIALNLQAFISQYYETSTHFQLRTGDSSFKKLFKLSSVMDMAQLLSKNELYWRNDIRLVKLDDEENVLMDGTPEPSRVTMQVLQPFITPDAGYSVHLKNVGQFSEEISHCLQMMDKWWRGQGGCYATVTYTPTGLVAFPTFAEQHDRFIFQIEGSQTILLYKPLSDNELGEHVVIDNDEENEEEGEEGAAALTSPPSSYPYFHYGSHLPITLYDLDQVDTMGVLAAQMEVKAGDICYIPQGYVAYCESEKNSLIVSIGLSKQASVEETIESMISEATTKLNMPSRVMPHDLVVSGDDTTKQEHDVNEGFASILKKQVHLLLQEAMKSEAAIMNRLMSRSMYSQASFYMSDQYLKQYDLIDLLNKNGGLVKISNFLPSEMADRLYTAIDSISEEEWILTQANTDAKRNNIDHAFHSTRSFAYSEPIFNIFRRLMPDCESAFSAGRYTNSHFIDPHDDRQYKDIDGEVYSRYVAVIYYLTPNWTAEDGGALVDIEGKKTYVPEYNSVVSFTIPRWHEVQPCLKNKPRYSVFGWFLKPGQLYELNTESSY